jgi:hypothetical protein
MEDTFTITVEEQDLRKAIEARQNEYNYLVLTQCVMAQAFVRAMKPVGRFSCAYNQIIPVMDRDENVKYFEQGTENKGITAGVSGAIVEAFDDRDYETVRRLLPATITFVKQQNPPPDWANMEQESEERGD